MRPIRLPEPPNPTMGVPEIFEGGAYSVIRRAVVIGNGSPGSENQSIGLIRTLGLSDKHVLYRVTRPRGGLNEWLHWLPVSLHKKLDYLIRLIRIYCRREKLVPSPLENGGNGSVGLASVLEADVKQIVTMARQTYEKDGPLLVVASGRDTISIASSIRRLASENVFVIQIKHPRSKLNRFDLVITPRHDFYPLTPQAQEQVPRFLHRWITPREPPDRHVVLTMGALHQIESAALRSAAAAWHDEFAPLPKPFLVVNIGWPTSHCRYGADLAKQLTASLLSILTSCGTVRISFSSRTPEKVSKVIVKELADNPKVYIWDGQEPNPCMGHLAWADAFVITADSVSLISEACSTGKPVYVMGVERCKWKLSDFHKSLRERGVVRPFTGSEDIAESWSYPPLNDTAEAANRVREALSERGWRVRP
ncbi:mitochondrial fission protein ELM1-like isoform X1 [Durio zibethinus]|uniref:Mitochondrial fission protein ELM1-like isoform X1 n=1 Tax=Durio zibethinus TaxID=66656 RepID=A0A6P5ZI38_DURZI|nr:mitochondrial fission protein ELM1-like isoform X1 [Durio zibethinus]XP_022752539.1 mitochondrial fission protein ELM1-like isoform X1 [Durio zibethinus]XP_022752541.1 mitochondrial fission protein ELM1-like isoform X1 [Durio zibethinus]